VFKFYLSEQNFTRRPYLKLSTLETTLVVRKLNERTSPVTVFVLKICGHVTLGQMTVNRHAAEIPSYRLLKNEIVYLAKDSLL
jgi:hypothetical protein